MRFIEALEITHNNTILVIREIEHLTLSDKAILNDDINLEASNSLGISELNSYYSLKRIDNYPYVRLNDVPKF